MHTAHQTLLRCPFLKQPFGLTLSLRQIIQKYRLSVVHCTAGHTRSIVSSANISYDKKKATQNYSLIPTEM
jgi:hypothetical protein